MQSKAACQACEPSDQGEEASAEGLCGQYLPSQADAGTPVCQVMGRNLHRQPGGVCSVASRWQVVQSDAVLEVTDGVFALCVSAVVCLNFKDVTLSVGDECVIIAVIRYLLMPFSGFFIRLNPK